MSLHNGELRMNSYSGRFDACTLVFNHVFFFGEKGCLFGSFGVFSAVIFVVQTLLLSPIITLQRPLHIWYLINFTFIFGQKLWLCRIAFFIGDWLWLVWFVHRNWLGCKDLLVHVNLLHVLVKWCYFGDFVEIRLLLGFDVEKFVVVLLLRQVFLVPGRVVLFEGRLLGQFLILFGLLSVLPYRIIEFRWWCLHWSIVIDRLGKRDNIRLTPLHSRRILLNNITFTHIIFIDIIIVKSHGFDIRRPWLLNYIWGLYSILSDKIIELIDCHV